MLAIFGHKATSGKGLENPVLLLRINLVNYNRAINSLISPSTTQLILIILHLLQQQKLQRLLSYIQNTPDKNPSAMSDGPPQLGEIPQQSEISVPTLKSTMETNGSSAGNGPQPASNTSLQNAKDNIYNSEVRSLPC